MGTVTRITPKGNYRVITVRPDNPFEAVELGESIAVSGPCLTVTGFDADTFTVEASQETIRLTTLKRLKVGGRVNLERAVRADARLGGHIVSGHIDCTLKVRKVETVGKSWQISIDLPVEFRPYVVDKGSVALDGISLTVIGVDAGGFTVNLIPETQKRTTLTEVRIGDEINVEFDQMGKYVIRFLQQREGESGLTVEAMRKMGY
jgi:riboflavin synthase